MRTKLIITHELRNKYNGNYIIYLLIMPFWIRGLELINHFN